MKAKARFENFLIRLFYGPQQRYQHLAGNEVKSDLQRIVPFQKLALVTLALPLGGFAFCVLWSMLYNFDDSTSTHCNVPNYLPSVSASIGAYSPQKYIWRLTIALHSAPRYLVSMTYYKLFHSSTCLLTLNCVEVSSLLGLSIISSTENFVIHAYCFLLFISSSFFGHMVHLFQENLWSLFKVRVFCINTIAWTMALFFYVRHNQHCEIGMYSLFAAAEYVFVVSNMIFHFQAYYDFAQVHFCASSSTFISNTKSIV